MAIMILIGLIALAIGTFGGCDAVEIPDVDSPLYEYIEESGLSLEDISDIVTDPSGLLFGFDGAEVI